MSDIVTVYVPKPNVLPEIAIGSGIVGSPTITVEGPRIRIDYEGALYGQRNLQTWTERVTAAHGRHVAKYPTIARAWVDPSDLIAVAEITPDGALHLLEIDKEDEEVFASWLNGEAIP